MLVLVASVDDGLSKLMSVPKSISATGMRSLLLGCTGWRTMLEISYWRHCGIDTHQPYAKRKKRDGDRLALSNFLAIAAAAHCDEGGTRMRIFFGDKELVDSYHRSSLSPILDITNGADSTIVRINTRPHLG